MTIHAFWWKPFGSLRDGAISVYRYGQAWAYLSVKNKSFSNFGDAVNEIYLSEVLGERVKWAPIDSADVIGIGSIIDLAEASGFNGQILGSGIRSSSLEVTRLMSSNFKAVRGKLTANRLGLDDDFAIGDPGLLARDLFPDMAKAVSRRSPLLIPHFNVVNSSRGRSIVKNFQNKGWKIAFPNLTPEKMAAEISSASYVATSSLHGLIFAHSYGIPANLIDFELGSREPAFKYDDYYSILGLTSNFLKISGVEKTPINRLIHQVEKESYTIASQLDSVIDRINRKLL